MMDNYKSLANAIIIQAVEDHRWARANPDAENALKISRDTMRFFRSEWFRQLTGINPDRLMAMLEAEDIDDQAACAGNIKGYIHWLKEAKQ